MFRKIVLGSLLSAVMVSGQVHAATLSCSNGPSFTPIYFKITLTDTEVGFEFASQSAGFYPGVVQSLASFTNQERHKNLYLDALELSVPRTSCPELVTLGQEFNCTLPVTLMSVRGTSIADEFDPPVVSEETSTKAYLKSSASVHFKVKEGHTEGDKAFELSGSFVEPTTKNQVPFLIEVTSFKKNCSLVE